MANLNILRRFFPRVLLTCAQSLLLQLALPGTKDLAKYSTPTLKTRSVPDSGGLAYSYGNPKAPGEYIRHYSQY